MNKPQNGSETDESKNPNREPQSVRNAHAARQKEEIDSNTQAWADQQRAHEERNE